MVSILVTTDGSQLSRSVLPHAVRLAVACDARLVLARVLDPAADLPNNHGNARQATVPDIARAWQAELEAVLQAAGASGTALVALREHEESTHEAIIRIAAEQDASLIAMHSRGSGALRHALLGSVAMGVLGHWPGPLLLTGGHARPPAASGPYSIVITSDGSPASLGVVPAIEPILAPGRIPVTLVRVCEPRSGRPGPEEEHAACLRQLESLRALLPAGVPAECRCCAAAYEQPVAGAIVEAAGEVSADSIAMSTQGHGALRHLLAGSVALDVLQRSPVPVVLARGRG